MLKAPESKRLNLEHVKTLSNFAFKFNMRRYTMGDPVFDRWGTGHQHTMS
jgi:hypothetical protein